MEPWVIGSAVGIFLLSILSDCIFKNTLLFTPIAACLLLQIIEDIGLFIAEYINPTFNTYNQYLLFAEGFIESTMEFYLLFLTPIKIANKYRITQEVTPAASVIATVMSVSYMLSKVLKMLYHAKVEKEI